MGRMTFVVRRLLMLIPVAIGVTIVVFFMIHLIPGDPARTILGIHATPQRIAILHKEWGLDRPLVSQYWLFMDRLLHGNLGQSLYYGTSARTIIFQRIPPTLWLIVYAALLAVIISVPLATIAATRKDAVRDQVVRAVPLLGLGMPPFWVGILLVYALAIKVRAFPVSGYGDGFFGHLHSMFLPSVTVALGIAPILVRSLRASLLEVLESEYIATARSKGLPERRVLFRHALRNAIISTVTVLGVNIGYLVGGTLLVEQVYGLPGVGQLMIASINQRDFPVVQAVTFAFAVMVVLVYLVTDVVHALLDPRVRFE